MAWGIKHLDEVPRQIHVVNGSPHIATIYVKVSMLIESVYVHKRDPKSGTQAIDITWKF